MSCSTVCVCQCLVSKLLIVLCGLYAHINMLCIVGPCSITNKVTPPTPASVLFALALCLCLASCNDLWPQTFRRPGFVFVIIFEIILTLFIMDITFKFVYNPLSEDLLWFCQQNSRFLKWLFQYAGIQNCSFLNETANWMASRDGFVKTQLIFSIGILYLAVYLTKMVDGTKQAYRQMIGVKKNRVQQHERRSYDAGDRCPICNTTELCAPCAGRRVPTGDVRNGPRR